MAAKRAKFTGKKGRRQRKLRHGPIEALESRVLLSGSIALSTSTWTPIGPAASAGGNVAGHGPVSGRVTGIAADPTNANVVYLASAGGGVWKTLDGGSSWSPLTDNQSTLFMGAIAIAPSNDNIIYAATGDATNSSQSFYGRGVLKSTNAGATWTLMGNTVFNRRTIAQVAVDPTNPNTVYVAVAGSGISGVTGNTGIYKSSDGGVTWTNTTASLSTTDRYMDIQIDPANPLHLFCSRNSGSGANGVYVSNDGATTWTLVGGGAPSGPAMANTKVAISPSNSQVVYASFSTSDSRLLGIFKSSDGGVTWTQLSNVPDYLAGNAFYSDTLAVDPHNSDVVYAGGVAGMLQSTDGGQSWADITVGVGGTTGTHWDHHADVFDANGRLLDGNDAGIWRLDNADPTAITWSDLNSNLQISTFLSGSLDPTNPDNAFAAGQDNAIAQFSGSLVWNQHAEGPNDGSVFIDPQDPNRVYVQTANTDAGPQNFIRRSDDGGLTWTGITNGIDPTEPQAFYAGFAIDPSNGNHLVYGTDRVYETYDGGNTWTPISNPNTNGWTVGATASIAKLAIAPSDPHTIYAADSGHIFVTTNDGATWTQRDPFNSPFGGIVVDPHNAQIAYVMGGQFGTSKIMRTADGGATWQNIAGNLPDLPTYALAINNGTLYAGNDNGVFVSIDDGMTWTRFAAGLPNVQVRDLEFDPVNNILAAFTYGRGAWEISTVPSAPLVVNTLADDTTPGDGQLSLREAIVAANTTGQSIMLDPSLAGGTINLDPANGPLIVTASITVNNPSQTNVTINTSGFPVEAAGSAVVRLNDFSFSSASGPAIQIDSAAWLSLQNATVNADITDNGRFSLYQFADGVISGVISGTGNLNKNGPATLRLSGAKNYLGQTSVRSGILIGDTTALRGILAATPGGTIAFDQSTLANSDGFFNGTVFGGGEVHVVGPASVVRMGTFGSSPATLTNAGPTLVDPGAALVASTTNDIGTNSPLIINGSFDLGGFDHTIQSVTGSGFIFNASSLANPLATLTVGNSVSTTFSGVLEDVPPNSGSAGQLALRKIGTSQLALIGANTYTGGTTIIAGGLRGNTLGLQGNIVANGSMTAVGLTFDQSLGGLGDGTFVGAVSGNASTSFNNGIVRLAPGSMLHNSQPTSINGTLIAGAPDQLGNAVVFVNGTFDLGGFDQTVGALLGAGTIYNSEPAGQSGLATLTLGSIGVVNSFTGVLEDHLPGAANNGILALNTDGQRLTLTGNNTYTGGTTVSGPLVVGPSTGDPLGTGPVVISSADSSLPSVSLQGQLTAPVQQIVPVTGFNQDVIVDASAPDTVSSTSTYVDNPTAGNGFVWYERGFGGAAAQGTGLPAGSVFTSLANPAVSFQLQPANANNVALLINSSATMQLVDPAQFSSLNFLAASANGQTVLNVKLNFADGSSTTTFFNVSDWFNGANAAIVAGGRVLRTPGASVSLTPGNPRLYELDYNLSPADQLKVLDSVTFSENNTLRVGVYAISGAELSTLPAQSYPNAVQVNADTTLDVENSSSAAFGNLTIGSSQLAFTGTSLAALSFTGVDLAGDHTFNLPAGLTLSVGPVSDGGGGYALGLSGPGTLVLNGADNYGGATSVDAGKLIVQTAGALPSRTALSIIDNGLVRLPSVGSPFFASAGSLNIAPGSQLDIGNNSFLINYGTNPDPLATIQSYLVGGYDGGLWDGAGATAAGTIVSASAASDASRSTAVGYRDVLATLDNGVLANTIWLKFTLYGDANLDGTVNAKDLVSLAHHLHQPGNWEDGDFNYDGVVDKSDMTALLANFGRTVPGAPSAMSAIAASAPSAVSGALTNTKARPAKHKHHFKPHSARHEPG